MGKPFREHAKMRGKDVREDKRAKVRNMLTRREVSVTAMGWKMGVNK